MQPFRPRILAALAAASPTLALELSPDDLLESQDDVSKYGVCRYPCLQRLLPEPGSGARRLRGNPAALVEIRKMRPWLAALVVETYDSLSAGLQTEYGTEAAANVPEEKGGRVISSETLAEQMRAFTGLTLAEQREMLAQDMVQTPAQNADDIKALHRLANWRRRCDLGMGGREERTARAVEGVVGRDRQQDRVRAQPALCCTDDGNRRAEPAAVRRDRRAAPGRPARRARIVASTRLQGRRELIAVTAPEPILPV